MLVLLFPFFARALKSCATVNYRVSVTCYLDRLQKLLEGLSSWWYRAIQYGSNHAPGSISLRAGVNLVASRRGAFYCTCVLKRQRPRRCGRNGNGPAAIATDVAYVERIAVPSSLAALICRKDTVNRPLLTYQKGQQREQLSPRQSTRLLAQ